MFDTAQDNDTNNVFYVIEYIMYVYYIDKMCYIN